ncbi:MAG: membrane dipeptidase [Ardenticatenia bacterium]|nr:membrane dipeptidase [Ardenticatenia bacterium]
MIAIDGHVHLAQDVLNWNRDVTQSVLAIRQSEAGMPGKGRGRGTIALPEMRRGRVALFGALICRSTDPQSQGSGLRTPEATYACARGELALYRVLEQRGLLRQIKDTAALDSHLADWEAAAPEAGGEVPPLGYILAMEGSDPILDPENVYEWWDDGLRMASLSHYGMGRYAAGTGPSGGVTDLGMALLREMEQCKIVLDTAHIAEDAFWPAVNNYDGPLAFSHGGTRALVPMWRSLSDEQMAAILERDGVVGISMDCWQITPGWVKGQATPDHVSLENWADHIDHVCQVAGDTDHACIGTDLDGGYGTEQSPRDVDSIADLQKIPDVLRRRGYAEDDVAKIMYGNWVRLFRETWA